MASSSTWLILPSTSSSVSLSSLAIGKNPFLQILPLYTPKKTRLFPIMVASSTNDGPLQKSTKLVTFLGKGGSGKTTSSVFAAQHYAMAGLKTCLVIQSQDPTADYLLNCKLGVSPITCTDNLSAVRLETSKMLLDPLNRLKQADARLNMTQGVLEGVVGEELGVLPGMDSIFSALALERLVGFFARNAPKDKYDVIVYDGLSTEELIRVLGTASKARLYLKYLRNLADKTDLGRLAGPSLLRLADEAVGLSSRGSNLDGKRSAEIWDELEQTLERGSSVFTDARKFGCYLVVDPNNSASVNSAFRYWGCAVQAGAQVSGVLGHASTDSFGQSIGILQKSFSPLPCSLIGSLPFGSPPNWKEIMRDNINKDARGLISGHNNNLVAPSVKFDHAKKSVTLLMPGFDKSEIKLYQYRGGSELLVEAGDQRRVIRLPPQIQGKVAGAKFTERSLVVTMR